MSTPTTAPIQEIHSSLHPDASGIRRNIEVVLNEQFNQLKARLMNLTETICGGETRQCNAMKGLAKDFLNQAYFGSVRRVHGELEWRGIIESNCSDGPQRGLAANSLADILVD